MLSTIPGESAKKIGRRPTRSESVEAHPVNVEELVFQVGERHVMPPLGGFSIVEGEVEDRGL